MFTVSKFIDSFTEKDGSNLYRKYCGFFPLEAIFTPMMLYETAIRCSSGFRDREDTQRFLENAFGNSERLNEQIMTGKFKPKYYKKKQINERGKMREIKPPTFECKVVQKTLCDFLIRPLIEPRCLPTCYAALKGKGTALMHEEIEKKVNEAVDEYETGKYGVQLVFVDYKGYFASVDLKILFGILSRYIHDSRIVDLIWKFYDGDKGLSLGDELSQLPASWFPTIVDNYIADRLSKNRFRYMDDAMLIAENMAEAEEYLKTVRQKSSEIGLTLKDKKTRIIQLGKSFTFCHERYIFGNDGKYHREINPSIIKAEKRKLRYAKNEIADIKLTGNGKEIRKITEKWNNQFRGWLGNIAAHPNTKIIQRNMKKMAKEAGILVEK